MSDNSAIEWTDATWNPVRARNKTTGKVGWHCEHATTGCEFCYAEGFNKRLGTGLAYKPGHRADIDIFLDHTMLTQPLRWKKPRMIFAGSMTDLFADFVPDAMLDSIFAMMALTPQHTYQVLTKRAERMWDYMTDPFQHNRMELAAEALQPNHGKPFSPKYVLPRILPNVWLGVSAERQPEASLRIPQLLHTPAAVRFLSAEPLLGPIDLMMLKTGDKVYDAVQGRIGTDIGDGEYDGAQPCSKLDWAIVGGESGSRARPMHPDWPRSLRDQCLAANVAFFFKQWGNFIPNFHLEGRLGRGVIAGPTDNGSYVAGMGPDEGCVMLSRVGKKKAGRLLDGVEHNALPPRASLRP